MSTKFIREEEKDHNNERVCSKGNDTSYLETIQKRNQERRATLQQLADEYENIIRQISVVENYDVSYNKPSIRDKVDAVQVDLDLLRENAGTTNFPRNMEPHQDGRPSSATEDRIWLERYATEVVQSYQDLQETSSVLEMVLKRERRKLDTKRDFIAQQQDLKAALTEEIQSIQERNKTKARSKEQDEESSTNNTNLQQLEQGNQWIRQELAYVATKFMTTEEETTAPSENPKRHRDFASDEQERRKQKKLDGGNQTLLKESSTSTPSGSRNLDQIVLDMMNRLLEDPVDPYLFLSRAEGQTSKEVNDTEENKETEELLRILRQCSVIETHPENERLFRLTDYRT